MATVTNALARNMKRIREERGLTQETLAESAGLSRTFVANLEREAVWVGPEALAQIAAALQCLETELFRDPEDASISTVQALRVLHESLGIMGAIHQPPMARDLSPVREFARLTAGLEHQEILAVLKDVGTFVAGKHPPAHPRQNSKDPKKREA